MRPAAAATPSAAQIPLIHSLTRKTEERSWKKKKSHCVMFLFSSLLQRRRQWLAATRGKIVSRERQCISSTLYWNWIRSRVAIFSSRPRSILELRNTRRTLERGREEKSVITDFSGGGERDEIFIRGKLSEPSNQTCLLRYPTPQSATGEAHMALDNCETAQLGRRERWASQTKLQPIR